MRWRAEQFVDGMTVGFLAALVGHGLEGQIIIVVILALLSAIGYAIDRSRGMVAP